MQKILTITTILSLTILTSCMSPFQSGPVVTPPASVATGVVMSPATAVSLTPFIARGTEPFWALEQTSTGAKFSQPSMSATSETWYTSTQTTVGTTISIVGIPVTTGPTLSATLTAGTCSDGMSDVIYAYTAVVTLGTGTLSGCAN